MRLCPMKITERIVKLSVQLAIYNFEHQSVRLRDTNYSVVLAQKREVNNCIIARYQRKNRYSSTAKTKPARRNQWPLWTLFRC